MTGPTNSTNSTNPVTLPIPPSVPTPHDFAETNPETNPEPQTVKPASQENQNSDRLLTVKTDLTLTACDCSTGVTVHPCPCGPLFVILYCEKCGAHEQRHISQILNVKKAER
jgi:hypothetical protein